MEKREVPDFAVFQNDRTKVSALWTKENGYWVECSVAEYDAIAIVAHLLRTSPDPQAVLVMLAEQMKRIEGGE